MSAGNATGIRDGLGLLRERDLGRLFVVLWYTALQVHVAPEALSRVIAYDTLGSIVLVPVAEAAAGPATDALGTSYTLWVVVALIVLPTLAVLGVPEVRSLRSQPEPLEARPGAPQ